MLAPTIYTDILRPRSSRPRPRSWPNFFVLPRFPPPSLFAPPFSRYFPLFLRVCSNLNSIKLLRTVVGVMYLMAVQACAEGGQWERALSLMVERRTMVARESREAKEVDARECYESRMQSIPLRYSFYCLERSFSPFLTDFPLCHMDMYTSVGSGSALPAFSICRTRNELVP